MNMIEQNDLKFCLEMIGILKKSDQHNKWQNRLCILKDNYLLWYKEDDAIRMNKSKCFNTKPQGVIFLNDCIIREVHDQTQQYCFIIEHAAFERPLLFAAENRSLRQNWMELLSFNSNISYQKFMEAERFIKELMETTSSIKYARVKQEYTQALDQNENLLKEKKDLEEENIEKRKEVQDLLNEFTKLKDELDGTYAVLRNVEESRNALMQKNNDLETELKSLEQQQTDTTQLLSANNTKTKIEELQKKLEIITLQKEKLDQDRKEVQKKLNERVNVQSTLEQENQRIVNQAQELNSHINQLKSYSSDIEKKFEAERAARIDAERRLKEAETSLERLHTNIVDGGMKYSRETKDEMKTDVNKLKDYFENIIRTSQPRKTSDSLSQSGSPVRPSFIKIKSHTMESENPSNETSPNSTLYSVFSPIPYSPKRPQQVCQDSKRLREEHRKRISLIPAELIDQ